MKHVPNGREESKTARSRGPENPSTNSQVGTQEPMKQEHSQQQAREHEATQCDKTAETNQREQEWVQMFQKISPYACTVEHQSPS